MNDTLDIPVKWYPCFAELREVLYEEGADGTPVVTGMRIGREGQVVKADAYVAALDVPGAKQLLPRAWRK